MPRYSYKCLECDHRHDVMHSYSVKLTDCNVCQASGSLQKLLNNFTTKIERYEQNEKVGSIVERNIEDLKRELKEEKEKLSSREYKNDDAN